MRGGTCKSELLTPVVSYWHWVFIQGGTERTKVLVKIFGQTGFSWIRSGVATSPRRSAANGYLRAFRSESKEILCVRYWTQVQFYYNTSSRNVPSPTLSMIWSPLSRNGYDAHIYNASNGFPFPRKGHKNVFLYIFLWEVTRRIL
jgi:hypothetical protein